MSGTRVLVVGAGPVGLATAVELARHGVACRVIDQAPAPSDKSKAIAVQPRTLEMLDPSGVTARLLAAGRRLHGANIYSEQRRIVHVAFDDIDSPYPFGLSIPQDETERILAEQLAGHGVTVERGVRLAALAVEEDAAEAVLARADGEETVRFPWLIGCDGAHSTVRHALGLGFAGEAYDEPFLLGDLDIEWALLDDEGHVFLAPGGIAAAFPLPGERRWRVVAEGAAGESPTVDDFAALLADHGAPPAKLSGLRWSAAFRVHRRIVERYRVGRAFLAGDAAHIHSPVGGQGMNTGIQDGCNLAWKLALVDAGAARPELLDSYDAERRPVAAATISGTDLATRMVTLRNPIARGMRDRLATFLSSLEVVQKRMLASASELAVGYRKSPIVGEHRAPLVASRLHGAHGDDERPSVSDWFDFGAGPRPGDRAPDVVLDGATHLFDLLRGTAHVLLLFDGAAATDEGYRRLGEIADRAARLGGRVRSHILVPRRRAPDALAGDPRLQLDPDGAAHNRYGAGAECLYLVRPDGYVAFRAQPADGDALDAYFTRIFA